jgi:putative sigma-54 modulation protein
MNIYELTGRNIEITEAMGAYAEEKLAKLDRFFDQIVGARVVMSYDERVGGTPARVEVHVNVPGGVIRAEERGVDSYAAVDLVVDKLERQLKRFKDRRRPARGEARPIAGEPEVPAADEPPAIVRTKRHVLRPMTPEDAAIEMEELGHTFFLFRDAASEEVCVIYLRRDGNYGLIQPMKSSS